ncbi:hypothetical protein G0U57_011888 [Chelydra serpentina]|uniref:Uncharacterized protein n=1 Tax=Chelydra serpentina TaxID=8475 RepID=A0A8T1SCG8_CHESE|nr:hypothetical protein G0U57_011888 [Chelydra serpentina]
MEVKLDSLVFARLPFEWRHIQLLQSDKSRAVSFTVQLFQMLNLSAAYLHCKPSICLNDHASLSQNCYENREMIPQQSDRGSYGNLHPLISFGPVLKGKSGFLDKQVEGGCCAFCCIPDVIWDHFCFAEHFAALHPVGLGGGLGTHSGV